MSYNPTSCPAQRRQHRCKKRNRAQRCATIGSIMQSAASATQLRARTCNTTQRTGRLLSPRDRNRSSCDLVPEPRATSSGAKPSPGEPRIASFGDAGRSSSSPRRLRGDHRLHRHPEFHWTTLCVSGPRNHGQGRLFGAGLFPFGPDSADWESNGFVDWRPLRHVRFHNAEANLAPATNEVGHLANWLGAFLLAR
jgi:hypothetical protein